MAEIINQIDFLRKKKSVAWVQDDKIPEGIPEEKANILYRYARRPGEFGPPMHDEKKNSYRWRHFKKGFNWGFILSSSIFYQYAYYSFVMTPALYSKRELMTLPLLIGTFSGIGFGFYEIMMNPQKTYKPIVHTLGGSMGKKLDEIKK